MPTAVLDQVEALQQKEQGRRSTSWLELVAAYVDNDFPAVAKVASVFAECGKTRTDLERAAALLREYRGLQQQLDQVPAMQAKLDQQAKAIKDALENKAAAERALQEALQRVTAADSEHSATGYALRQLRKAAEALQHPKFNAVVDREPTLPANVLAVQAEIQSMDHKLEEGAAQIVKQRERLASLEGEAEALPGQDMDDDDKQEKAASLRASIDAAMRSIDGLEGQQYYLTGDRNSKRRELRTLQAGL